MKTKKNLLAIAFTIAISLTMLTILTGCFKLGKEEINLSQSNNDDDEFSERGHKRRWIDVPIDEELNFEDEVIDIIDELDEMGTNDNDYDLYLDNDIREITKFYSLDNLEIDDYRLYSASITPSVFLFNFVLVDSDSIDDGSICIQIYRPEQFPGVDLFEDALKQIQETDTILERESSYFLSEDGLLYEEAPRLISARLDDTFFSIQLSDGISSYEYMRDLAFQVIETAELIEVSE